jgi:hypothetical protein
MCHDAEVLLQLHQLATFIFIGNSTMVYILGTTHAAALV